MQQLNTNNKTWARLKRKAESPFSQIECLSSQKPAEILAELINEFNTTAEYQQNKR